MCHALGSQRVGLRSDRNPLLNHTTPSNQCPNQPIDRVPQPITSQPYPSHPITKTGPGCIHRDIRLCIHGAGFGGIGVGGLGWGWGCEGEVTMNASDPTPFHPTPPGPENMSNETRTSQTQRIINKNDPHTHPHPPQPQPHPPQPQPHPLRRLMRGSGATSTHSSCRGRRRRSIGSSIVRGWGGGWGGVEGGVEGGCWWVCGSSSVGGGGNAIRRRYRTLLPLNSTVDLDRPPHPQPNPNPKITSNQVSAATTSASAPSCLRTTTPPTSWPMA